MTALARPVPRSPASLFSAEPIFAAAGALLALSLAITLAASAIDPRLFGGDSIWLKPIKFQIALSLYLLTLAAYARWLPHGLTDRRCRDVQMPPGEEAREESKTFRRSGIGVHGRGRTASASSPRARITSSSSDSTSTTADWTASRRASPSATRPPARTSRRSNG